MNFIKPLAIIAALITALVVGFGYGLAVMKFHIKPYYAVRRIEYALKSMLHSSEQNARLIQINKASVKIHLEDITNRFRYHKEVLLERVVLPRSLVTFEEVSQSSTISDVYATFYGIRVHGILQRVSSNRKSCLIIYNQGHGGNPFKYEHHNVIVKKGISNGCDVLSLSMIGLGLNEGSVEFPAKAIGLENVSLGIDQARDHGNYSLYHDKKLPMKDPLSLFLSGHYYLIKQLAVNYDFISMIGISGGGWYTTWLAALIDEIDVSVSYAGTLPLAFRAIDEHHGDWEQVDSELYDDYDYWSLYQLGTINDKGAQNRKVILVYNSHDSCCFMDPEASQLKGLVSSLDLPNIDVIVDASIRHALNVDLAFPFLVRSNGKVNPVVR